MKKKKPRKREVHLKRNYEEMKSTCVLSFKKTKEEEEKQNNNEKEDQQESLKMKTDDHFLFPISN